MRHTCRQLIDIKVKMCGELSSLLAYAILEDSCSKNGICMCVFLIFLTWISVKNNTEPDRYRLCIGFFRVSRLDTMFHAVAVAVSIPKPPFFMQFSSGCSHAREG
jgi:hypothetical protein